MSLSFELLERLASSLESQGAPVVGNLQPGLSIEEMDLLTEPLNLHLPLEARIWWGWRNGASKGKGARELSPLFDYLPLEEAIEVCKWYRINAISAVEGMSEPLDNPEWWWSGSWFPITEIGSGGVVAVDCSTPKGMPTPIRCINYHWGPGEDPGAIEARSFGEMVEWWIDAINRGAWRYDVEEGKWDYRTELTNPAHMYSSLV